jgi:hypothetical protein
MSETRLEQGTSTIPLTDIDVDKNVQPRQEELDTAHIDSLIEAGPEAWPPLIVVHRDERYILIDGHHRLQAAHQLELESISCEIRPDPHDGDFRALAFALNTAHGKALTLADRKAEAERLLRTNVNVSNSELARRCGLSDKTVARIREELEGTSEIPRLEQRMGADGKMRPVSQGRSGRSGIGVTTSTPASAKDEAAGVSSPQQSSPDTTRPQPSLVALNKLVDQTCTFLEDYAGDELGDVTAKAVRERWPDRDLQEIATGMRTLGQQLLAGADRVEHHTSEELALDKEEAA